MWASLTSVVSALTPSYHESPPAYQDISISVARARLATRTRLQHSSGGLGVISSTHKLPAYPPALIVFKSIVDGCCCTVWRRLDLLLSKTGLGPPTMSGAVLRR